MKFNLRYFIYFAIPGSTWTETNSFGRAVHLTLTGFGGGGYGLALMPMGLDVRTWWKEKKFMLYWSLKYTTSFIVISFIMMEATGAKKELHMTYVMAMLALTIILLPLYEGVRFLAGDNPHLSCLAIASMRRMPIAIAKARCDDRSHRQNTYARIMDVRF